MKFTKEQLEDLAKIELLIRHAWNINRVGPEMVQHEAMYKASDAFKRFMGKEYDKIFKTKTWKDINK